MFPDLEASTWAQCMKRIDTVFYGCSYRVKEML